MSCFTLQYRPLTCLIWIVIQSPLQKHFCYQITFNCYQITSNYVNESHKARTVSIFPGTLATGTLLFLLYHVNKDWTPNCHPECPRGSPRLIKNCSLLRGILLVECCQKIFSLLFLSLYAFPTLVWIPWVFKIILFETSKGCARA